jgi:hypothetical protein
MTKRFVVFLIVAAAVSDALAQSIPTATINGKVSADGAALPGVSVTASSPNLQGTRTTVTTQTGDYLIPLLPPGNYTVKFELSGMATANRRVVLTAANTERIDVEMRPAAVAEAITVTAETPITAPVESTQVSANFKQDLIEALPMDRTIRSVALLSPGVNNNGPSGGNIMISGAMSFDSLYLVNGAIVNENLRGQPHSLFIEDAIQETTILTGGISAEYGHFTGGVVNTITKSGGNNLHGSFRSNLSNDKWTALTPLTTEREDKLNQIHEATLGGPFLRDRLWFFAAGRSAKNDDIRQTVPGLARAGDQDVNGNQVPIGTPLAAIGYPHGTKERRLEGKLTGAITNKHTLIASILDIKASETNQTGQVIMDLDSLVARRETPNSIRALNYNGVLTDQFFVEGQYSKKRFSFVGSGSSFYDLIKGTLITDRARGTRYWSPTFRKTKEGEQRDIQDYTVKATYFVSHPTFGSQEVRAGFEHFNELRRVNNYQNGSDYRISVPNTIVRGAQIFPRMPGGATGTQTRISWLPIFVLSKGSNYTTKSLYLNDRWILNPRWSFNLGVRYDKNNAISGDHSFKIADDSAFSPRLGAHYDIFGNQRVIVNASYGKYIGRLSEGAANDGDPAGRNASLQWDYRGPSINNDVNTPTSALIPTDKAMQMIFDWFFANGGTNRRPFRTSPSVPGVDSVLDPRGVQSPATNEWTIGVGSALGTRGFVRGDLVFRRWDKFYTSYRDVTTGKTTDQFGTQYDLAIIRSDNGLYNRKYDAVQTQFNYRLFTPLQVGGTYTWSRLKGNLIGENTGSGPLVGEEGWYPQYRQESWNYPTRFLPADQRHRARLWASYDLPSPVGTFNLSVLQQFDSGTPGSVIGSIDSRPYVTNPGYLTPPATVNYFFSTASLKSDIITRTDLAVNYKVRLTRGIDLFIQPEIFNVFNEHGVLSFNQEVLTAVDCTGSSTQNPACPAGGLKAFNPFKETPVEGVNYIKGPGFGKPDSVSDFQLPRTYRFSLGIKF